MEKVKNTNSVPKNGQNTSFFQTTRITEFTVAKTGEIWIFGTLRTRITSETPRQFIGIDSVNRSDRKHVNKRGKYTALPITDEYGETRYVNGWAVGTFPHEIEKVTSAWERITAQYPNAFDGWV